VICGFRLALRFMCRGSKLLVGLHGRNPYREVGARATAVP
jgi:hypothetical protein